MSLQEITIKRYLEQFPNQSLREISTNTNIQITRVFRLLNGSPMKLMEYEAFERVIDQKSFQNKVTTQDFISTSKECLQHLSETKLNELIHEMKQSLKIKQFIKMKSHLSFNNQMA